MDQGANFCGGHEPARSVWSACSLLPLSVRDRHPNVYTQSKAAASCTHSIRFARFVTTTKTRTQWTKRTCGSTFWMYAERTPSIAGYEWVHCQTKSRIYGGIGCRL